MNFQMNPSLFLLQVPQLEMNKVFFYIKSFIKPFYKRMMQIENISLNKNPHMWEENKQKMFEILKKAPMVGVYKNQDPAHWNTFFKFYIDFLNSQSGPRGLCAKKIRKQLKQNYEIVDQVLKPYKLCHTMHIRSLYVRFKFFIPCQQYHLYTTTLDALSKCEESLFRLKQPGHPMYKSIMEGMLKKHGVDYSYQEEIHKLKVNYETKIQKLQQSKTQYEQILSESQEYINWTNMNKVMKKWFDEWVEADSGMGKESCNRGGAFQTKVLYEVLPQIIDRQRKKGVLQHIKEQQLFSPDSINQLILQSTASCNKKAMFNKIHIFLNMKWTPRSLGQIDIAIVQFVEEKQRYEALVLIQCKARLFDIRQASYQVFSQYLKPEGKIQLSGKYGPISVSENVVSYIVTTLPDYDFVLPIESNLKAALDRITKDKPIEQISENQMKQILFNECSNKFSNEPSPLDWFVKNDSQKIIVLTSQS